ncbi:MAG: hypothetical protein JXR49_02500 [Acidobacteria bacterium]|nr:hypothetical protein [Acidobacteriota bacterium]
MLRITKTFLVMLFAVAGTPGLAGEVKFDGISCQSDIAKALIGRYMPNEAIFKTKAKYPNLRLTYLGGFGMPEDPYFLGTWVICGTEYLILENPSSIVQDVLKSPIPYTSARSTFADCTAEKGQRWPMAIIFQPITAGKPPLLVQKIWEIDESKIKFRSVSDGNFSCKPWLK